MPSSKGALDRAETRALLAAHRVDEVAQIAAVARSVAQDLYRLLYDEDHLIRHRAADALGQVAALQPDAVAALPARLTWALNDESGMNCRGAAPALAEIAYHNPDLAGGFVPGLVHFLDDPNHLAEVLWAIQRLAPRFPAEVAEVAGAIEGFLGHPTPEVRALAACALAAVAPARRAAAGGLLGDGAMVEVYQDGEMLHCTVGELTASVLAHQ